MNLSREYESLYYKASASACTVCNVLFMRNGLFGTGYNENQISSQVSSRKRDTSGTPTLFPRFDKLGISIFANKQQQPSH